MKPAIYSTLVTAVIAGLLALVTFAFLPSNGWPPPESPPRQGEALDASAYSRGVFVHSDKALSRVVREPTNTWSNLAFVWVGAFLAFFLKETISKQSAFALVTVGVGSFFYHASASRSLRHCDVGAMYWIYGVLIILAIGSLCPRVVESIKQRYLLISIGLPVIATALTFSRNWRVAGIKPFDLSLVTGIAAAIATAGLVVAARKSNTPHTWWRTFLTLLFFGSAIALQLGDRPGRWACNPSSYVQGHALWHIFAAVACGLACIQLSKAWSPAPSN